MELLKFRASTNDEGRTLFKYLIKVLPNVPVSKIEKVLRLKDVKVNNKKTNDKSYKVQVGDSIFVYGIEDHKAELNFRTQVTFKVIFEDENILVIDKPINIAVHGEDNCLDYQVLSYLNYNKVDSFIPSHIGRLDKKTSGLIVYAKTYKALTEMKEKSKHFEKYYVLKSDFPWEKKEVVLWNKYNPKTAQNEISEIDNGGIRMETIFFTERNKKYARIITGKKHQIRMTLQYLKFPIRGDRRYGGTYGSRVFLHSHKVVFHNLVELDYLNGTSFISNIKW